MLLFRKLSPKDAKLSPKKYIPIQTFIADAADVNSNRIKTLLADDLSTFFIKGNPLFSNGLTSLARNPPDCPIGLLIILY